MVHDRLRIEECVGFLNCKTNNNRTETSVNLKTAVKNITRQKKYSLKTIEKTLGGK